MVVLIVLVEIFLDIRVLNMDYKTSKALNITRNRYFQKSW